LEIKKTLLRRLEGLVLQFSVKGWVQVQTGKIKFRLGGWGGEGGFTEQSELVKSACVRLIRG
jgi:hypothetical protein